MQTVKINDKLSFVYILVLFPPKAMHLDFYIEFQLVSWFVYGGDKKFSTVCDGFLFEFFQFVVVVVFFCVKIPNFV